jgi:transcriptional regulator with XRE-family HTH domain
MDQQPASAELTRSRPGQELARLRRDSRMPQRELAMRLFVERSYVSHAESGRMLPARRFWELADRELGANGSLVALFERALLVDRVSDHDARGPGGPADASRSDAVGLGQVPDAGSVSEFGPSSRRRTAAILEQMSEQNRATRLRYVDSPEPGARSDGS